MNKWLAPSSINFLKMHRELTVGEDTLDNPVNELSRKLSAEQMPRVPKMQVSEKDGQMFALNNSSLQLTRQLEKQGKLQRGLIQVEVVPLSKVPANIQMAMIADINSSMAGDYCTCIDDLTEQADCSKSDHNHRPALEATTKISGLQAINATNSDDDSDRQDEQEDDDDEHDDEVCSNGSSSSDETMQCNVCDHTFSCAKLLAAHQLKKKHFGCSVCDTVFPSLGALEEHKKILDHWSDDDNPLTEDERPQRDKIERLL